MTSLDLTNDVSTTGPWIARRRVYVGGVPCDPMTREELLDVVSAEATAHHAEPLLVCSVNLMHVGEFGVDSPREAFFDDSESRGRRWMCTVDGRPIESAARRLTREPWPKLSGSDVLEEILSRAAVAKHRVGNLGATPEANARLVEVARERWPDLEILTWSPSREDIEERGEDVAREIAQARVDILIVSLPKPVEELWVEQFATLAGAGVYLAFGGSVDFLVGHQVRAPKLFQRVGAEWLWRLGNNPRRMWRRYVVEGPGEFIRAVHYRTNVPVVATADQWRRRIAISLLGADAAVVTIASLLAALARRFLTHYGFVGYSPSWATVLLSVPLVVVSIGSVGGRRATGVRLDARLFERFLVGLATGAALIGLVSYLFKLDTARGYVVLLVVTASLGGATSRAAIALWLSRSRHRGRNLVRLLAVGSTPALSETSSWFDQHPECGYRVVGRVDDLPVTTPLVGVLAIGSVGDVSSREADELMRRRGEVMVVPDLTAIDASRLHPNTFADLSVLHVTPVELDGRAAVVKRLTDVTVASLVLLLISPVLLASALAIYAEDRGPVLFRQRRVGRDGEEFTVLKLRSMVINADAQLESLREQNEAGPHLFKMARDPRVTRTGRFIRSWSLDELPQLWNVVRGDMSLVGPRPSLPSEVVHFPDEALRRHRVRPGITGLWQVSGRSDLDSTQALSLDVHYVANWSLAGDLRILLRTVHAVLARSGAV